MTQLAKRSIIARESGASVASGMPATIIYAGRSDGFAAASGARRRQVGTLRRVGAGSGAAVKA